MTTYWLEPTDEIAVGLRRYSRQSDNQPFSMECDGGYHSALIYIDRVPAKYSDRDSGGSSLEIRPKHPHDDAHWPTKCSRCDYRFTDDDHWQEWQELIYRRSDSDGEYVLHQNAPAPELGIESAPPGASWNAWWMPSAWRRTDGMYLMVRLPNGHDWAVDSEASNCTRKGESHECWCRHGDPRLAHVTVDKNGDTCAAGAGSIQGGDYHGFLRDGLLTAG